MGSNDRFKETLNPHGNEIGAIVHAIAGVMFGDAPEPWHFVTTWTLLLGASIS